MVDKRPFFFLHIPKTAGLTMQSFIARHFAAKDIAAAFTLTTLLGLERGQVEQRKLFQGHFFGAMEHIMARHVFRFTILRDPVERALSHYGHVVRDHQHYLHRRALELGTFEAYLDDPITGMTVINFQARMLALDCDVGSLYQELTEQERQEWCLEKYVETTDFKLSNEAMLSKAKQRLAAFDVVGVTERFDETLALLCLGRGWSYPEGLNAQNVNKDRLRREALPPQVLNRLVDLNAVDFALYESVRVSFDETYRRMLAGLISGHTNRFTMQRLRGWLNG